MLSAVGPHFGFSSFFRHLSLTFRYDSNSRSFSLSLSLLRKHSTAMHHLSPSLSLSLLTTFPSDTVILSLFSLSLSYYYYHMAVGGIEASYEVHSPHFAPSGSGKTVFTSGALISTLQLKKEAFGAFMSSTYALLL